MQVHNAAAAHINTHSQALILLTSPTTNNNTITPRDTNQVAPNPAGMPLPLVQAQMTNRYMTSTPALLPSSRCYVNVSTTPDHPGSPPTTAGLGVFILNFQAHPTQMIYIKARLHQCTSVIMAEAASLALASSLI